MSNIMSVYALVPEKLGIVECIVSIYQVNNKHYY